MPPWVIRCAYIHRTNRHGYKAGALQAGMEQSDCEFIAIFDADFVPPPQWLRQVIHHFTDPKIGMVQTRWTHLNRNYSFLSEVEAILLDGHFVLEHRRPVPAPASSSTSTARLECGAAQAIEEAGGWEHDTLTEDTDLSYRSQMKGWKFAYLQDVECPAELPVEMTAFKTQQARWAKGLIQVSQKILPRVMKDPNVPKRVKFEALYHLTANLSYPLMIVLSVLLMPAMIIRFYQGWFQMLYIDMPLFMASTFSISSFYLVSQKELFPKNWYRAFLYLPFLMSLGIGLTITNAKAVLEALRGKQTAFARTPKYRVTAKGDKAGFVEVPQTPRLDSLDRTADRLLLRLDRLLRLQHGELLHRAVPDPFRRRLLVHRIAVAAARPLRTPRLARRTTNRQALSRGGILEVLERRRLQTVTKLGAKEGKWDKSPVLSPEGAPVDSPAR